MVPLMECYNKWATAAMSSPEVLSASYPDVTIVHQIFVDVKCLPSKPQPFNACFCSRKSSVVIGSVFIKAYFSHHSY